MLSGDRTRPRSMHKHTSAALNATKVDDRQTIAAKGHVDGASAVSRRCAMQRRGPRSEVGSSFRSLACNDRDYLLSS
jgi:hypothetical protein